MVNSVTRSLADGSTSAVPPAHAAAFLIVVLDCGQPLRRPLRMALDPLTEVSIGRGGRRTVTPSGAPDKVVLKLPDAWLSSSHLRLRRVGRTWLYQDDAAKNPTLLNGVACREAILSDGDVLSAGATLLLFCVRPIEAGAGAAGDRDVELERRQPWLTTLVPALDRAFSTIARVARSDVPVLIRGETGTGKEVMARAIHEQSGLRGAFVPVNCGGLPVTLIESELFGARKGAYSGLHEDRPGLIRASDGGTLFLDEVAELPAAAQATLLRVLQDGEVRPVGHNRALKVSLRLVCATHRDLEAMIEAGQFRRDLYARMAGHLVVLPPLRQRREDLGLLVAELLERRAGERAAKLSIAAPAARALFAHDWPMNVRELEQCLASALAMVEGTEIGLAHLPAAVRDGRPRAAPSAPGSPALTAAPIDQVSRVAELLREHDGNISAVARVLATSRSQVSRLARRARAVESSRREADGETRPPGDGKNV